MFRSLAEQDGFNTDIIFSGVTRMAVQTVYDGLSLHESEANGPQVTVKFMNAVGDYVVCSDITVLKNKLDRFHVPVPVAIVGQNV